MLLHKTTAERSEAELQEAWEAYVASKTVDGRFCPTPELRMATDDDDSPPASPPSSSPPRRRRRGGKKTRVLKHLLLPTPPLMRPPLRRAAEALATLYARSRPVAVVTQSIQGRKMKALCATADIPANTKVAVYIVQAYRDEDVDDTEYAVALRKMSRGWHDGWSGVPTEKTLKRKRAEGLPNIAFFANEPTRKPKQEQNCYFIAPRVRVSELKEGKMAVGTLMTTRNVRKGEHLVWCYGDDYHRSYKPACDDWERSP